MAIESRVYNSDLSSTTYVWDHPAEALLQLAKIIHDLTNYEIIDSWGTGAGRFIGDPIASATWANNNDVGAQGYFVFQPTNPTYAPTWQAIVHSSDVGHVFADPSGIDHGWQGLTPDRTMIRFAPEGGWNSVTQDFANHATKVTDNIVANFDNGAGRLNGFVLTADEDTIFCCVRMLDGDIEFINVPFYVGDYQRKNAFQTNPRILMAANGDMILNLRVAGGFIADNAATLHSIWYLDETGAMVQYDGEVRSRECSANVYTVPNTRVTSRYRLDLFPIQLKAQIAPDVLIGELRLLALGYGIGQGLPIANKSWIATQIGYGVYIQWDGITDVR